MLLPWALPTVVAALVWRFVFDSESGLVHGIGVATGSAVLQQAWLSGPLTAWVPIVLGDVWKTTPFVALLLLAGLQGIDPALYEAARLDGAGAWRRFTDITLPLLGPALLVAVLFPHARRLPCLRPRLRADGRRPRHGDGGRSRSTRSRLLQDLRFGYGSALAVLVFAASFALALAYVRALGAGGQRRRA